MSIYTEDPTAKYRERAEKAESLVEFLRLEHARSEQLLCEDLRAVRAESSRP